MEDAAYFVNRAQWDDKAHTVAILDVWNLDTGEKFSYVTRESDPATLNQKLWAMIMVEPDNILPTEVELITSGEKELPPGKTLIDLTLYDDEEQKAVIRGTVRGRLAELTTPEMIARAELDAEFRALRLENMRDLLAVENQEGFPYNVVWPDQIV